MSRNDALLRHILLVAWTVLLATVTQTGHAADGAAIYQEKCAVCHGDDGQGVAEEYDKPLLGERSIDALARLIDRTMPSEQPEECVGDEAREVATYMYHAFYSLAARQRKGLGPVPRVELARLTVPQYRNVIADMVGRFTPNSHRDASVSEPGLRAEYFQSKGMSKADKLQEQRVDAAVDFDYQERSPLDGITADEFAIIWEGSLRAPETGNYEFRVTTQNGARLYLNYDPQQRRGKLRDDSSQAGQAALIDAWVSSGQLRESTTRVFLLGGRHYPIRLEFFKYKEETSSIRLEWKPPHGVWSLLDREHLSTASSPRTFVVDTPFPPDDRSVGYERGTSISREWHQAVSDGAVATAAEIIDRLPFLLGVSEGDDGRDAKMRELAVEFAEAAFRRPLSDEERALIGTHIFDAANDSEAGLRRAILYVLSSPPFIYADLTPPETGPDAYAVAARLALSLWDSIPDQPLLDAAAAGTLAAAPEIEAQARRMIADPRSRQKLQGFFHHWLELDERDLAKDLEMFPEFDEAVIADLRRSLEHFVAQVLWSEGSDYRELLLADYLMLNGRLAQLYGEAGEVGSGDSRDFVPVSDTSGRRAGVLTHPYLLSAFAYHNNTSPIHRGVFLTRNIVGRSLKPPPIAVAFKNDEFAADLTMREKITQLTRDTACMSCHSVINPLGFALENFDAVGRWRTEDGAKPVDSRSEYVTEDGERLEVTGARDIARFAASNEAAHRAFVTQLFYHLVKQPPAAYGPEVPEELRLGFEADEFHMQNLIVRIATLSAAHGL